MILKKSTPLKIVTQAGLFPNPEGIFIESGKVIVSCLGVQDSDFTVEIAPKYEDTWKTQPFFPPANSARQRAAMRRTRNTIHYSGGNPFRIRLNVTDFRNDFLVWIEVKWK